MNIKVVYHSASGNTGKIAGAIADALNVTAIPIDDKVSFSEQIDLLFIGDGVYGGKPSQNTKALIKSLDPAKIKNAAVFGTFGGSDKAITVMKSMLADQGIKVKDKSFGCNGKSWFFFNRSRPNANDIDNARKFAKAAADSII